MKSALIYNFFSLPKLWWDMSPLILNVLLRLEQAEFFIGLMRLFKLRSITIPLLSINLQSFKNWAFSQDTRMAEYFESVGVT